MTDLVELFFVALLNAFAIFEYHKSGWFGVALLLLCIPVNTLYGLSYAAAATPGSSRWVEGFILAVIASAYFVLVFWTITSQLRRGKGIQKR